MIFNPVPYTLLAHVILGDKKKQVILGDKKQGKTLKP